MKSVIWAVSLGSGTSGGVLAPLLMIGGALGGVEAQFLPFEGIGFWPLISMSAILGGTMRSPFTGIVFAMELTHDFHSALPLLVANIFAYALTVLLLKRSILTEKVSRRGFHLSREYAVDPLEILFVREVMQTNVAVLPAKEQIGEFLLRFRPQDSPRGQHLYPVVDPERRLQGVVTRKEITRLLERPDRSDGLMGQISRQNPVIAYPDEPLRVVVYRMAETGFTRLPVADHAGRLVGMISLHDLLGARARNLHEERQRERVLRIRSPFGPRDRRETETEGRLA